VSSEEPRDPAEGQAPPAGGSREPTEDELRAAYEAELSRLTSADLIAQAAVSLLNMGARRLGPIGEQGAPGGEGGDPGAAEGAAGERDLPQARDAIDAVRALLEILERSVPGDGLRPLRDALSQLQMAYAREVQAEAGTGTPGASAPGGPAAPGASGGQAGQGGTPDAPPTQEQPGEPGPAQRSGRLWVPGS
jgi:hypothetical protein